MTLPLTGHAMEAPDGPIVGVTLHGLHAFAGGLWLGTLAVALFAWQRSDPPERSGRRHARLERLIGKFSPLALISAFVVVATGSAEALWLVGSFRALRETVYGQRLLLKLGLLVVLLGIGIYNWRVLRPLLGGGGQAAGCCERHSSNSRWPSSFSVSRLASWRCRRGNDYSMRCAST